MTAGRSCFASPCPAVTEMVRPEISDRRGYQYHGWKRHVEEEQRDERGHRQGPRDAALQRSPPDPQDGLHDEHQDRALQAEEQGVDDRHLAGQRVEQGQPEHDDGAGQDEDDTRREAALHAVQQPAEVGGELLRFGSRQQVAETQRVQKSALADPVAFVDHFLVQQRDLPGRPAE